jgi:hypothetical protein
MPLLRCEWRFNGTTRTSPWVNVRCWEEKWALRGWHEAAEVHHTARRCCYMAASPRRCRARTRERKDSLRASFLGNRGRKAGRLDRLERRSSSEKPNTECLVTASDLV